MLKLIFFLLGALAVPAVTWWMESRDPVKADVRRMADRDRQAQAVRLPQRRMQYAQIVMPPLLEQRRQTNGQM